MVSKPVSAVFLLLSLAMAGLAALGFLQHLSQGDAISTFAVAVLGPIGFLGALIWGLALKNGD